MGTVINRTTKQIIRTAHTPLGGAQYPPAQWVIYRKAAGAAKIAALDALLATVPMRHIKFDGSDNPLEMTAGEKTAVDEGSQRLTLSSGATNDFDGVPVVRANGSDTHTISIGKVGLGGSPLTSGAEALKVDANQRVPVSNSSPALASGTGSFTVGPIPSGEIVDVVLRVSDPTLAVKAAQIKIRFR
jgi:hypothetical protein